MGLVSASSSITRYKVEGELEAPVSDKIESALKTYSFEENEEDYTEKSVGWTTIESPYIPRFETEKYTIGSYLVFALRVDKKTIPTKIIKKYYAIEMEKRLKETGRKFLSRNEKKMLKDHIMNILALRIPATPSIYDLVWNYEEKRLWFFATQKSANEELETLFFKTFNLMLVRLFPYTVADLSFNFNESEKDILNRLAPVSFNK